MKRLALACVVLGLVALAGCHPHTPPKGPAPPKSPAPPAVPDESSKSPAPRPTDLAPAKSADDGPTSPGRGPAPEGPGPRGAGAPAGEGAQHTEEIQAVVEKKLPDDSTPDDGKSPPAKP